MVFRSKFWTLHCDNYSTPKSRFTCFFLILHATFSFKIVRIFAEASEETMEASSSVLAVVWTEKFSIFFRNQNRNLEVLTPGETQLRTATTRNERSCVEGWILWGQEDFYWWFWWFTFRINKWFAPHQASLFSLFVALVLLPDTGEESLQNAHALQSTVHPVAFLRCEHETLPMHASQKPSQRHQIHNM